MKKDDITSIGEDRGGKSKLFAITGAIVALLLIISGVTIWGLKSQSGENISSTPQSQQATPSESEDSSSQAEDESKTAGETFTKAVVSQAEKDFSNASSQSIPEQIKSKLEGGIVPNLVVKPGMSELEFSVNAIPGLSELFNSVSTASELRKSAGANASLADHADIVMGARTATGAFSGMLKRMALAKDLSEITEDEWTALNTFVPVCIDGKIPSISGKAYERDAFESKGGTCDLVSRKYTFVKNDAGVPRTGTIWTDYDSYFYIGVWADTWKTKDGGNVTVYSPAITDYYRTGDESWGTNTIAGIKPESPYLSEGGEFKE